MGLIQSAIDRGALTAAAMMRMSTAAQAKRNLQRKAAQGSLLSEYQQAKTQQGNLRAKAIGEVQKKQRRTFLDYIGRRPKEEQRKIVNSYSRSQRYRLMNEIDKGGKEWLEYVTLPLIVTTRNQERRITPDCPI